MAGLNCAMQRAACFNLPLVSSEDCVRVLEEIFATPFERPVILPADFNLAHVRHGLIDAEGQGKGQLIDG